MGIHTPETDGERSVEKVRQKVNENDLPFAVAVDNGQKNWAAWSNHVWPAIYLIDTRGYVRYW